MVILKKNHYLMDCKTGLEKNLGLHSRLIKMVVSKHPDMNKVKASSFSGNKET
jgi:hypothetical protein